MAPRSAACLRRAHALVADVRAARRRWFTHLACLRGVRRCFSSLSCAGHRSRDSQRVVQRTFAPLVAVTLGSAFTSVLAVTCVTEVPAGSSRGLCAALSVGILCTCSRKQERRVFRVQLLKTVVCQDHSLVLVCRDAP